MEMSSKEQPEGRSKRPESRLLFLVADGLVAEVR